jgi:hypothetical protein
MKKIFLFLSALFLSATVFSNTVNLLEHPFNIFPGITGEEDDEHYGAFDEGLHESGGRIVKFTDAYAQIGWDLTELDITSDAAVQVRFRFTSIEPEYVKRQFEFHIRYSNGTIQRNNVIQSIGEIDFEVNQELISQGYQITAITLNIGWGSIPPGSDPARPDECAGTSPCDPSWGQGGTWDDPAPTEDNPVFILYQRAEIVYGQIVVPQVKLPVITFDEVGFEVGDKFNKNDFYGIHVWGATAVSASIQPAPGREGNALQFAPTSWNFAAMFRSLELPCDQIVSDIESVQFDIYFESYDEYEEGDGIYSELMMYFGDPAVRAVRFSGDEAFTFSGAPSNTEDGLAGVIGEWITISLNIIDFYIPSLNIGGEHFSTQGMNNGTTELSRFAFGLGINAANSVYYIDNIKFNGIKTDCETAIQSIASAPSFKVYSSQGGLFIDSEEKAFVYGIDGSLIATANGQVALPKGIYIVRVGSEAVKAIVR